MELHTITGMPTCRSRLVFFAFRVFAMLLIAGMARHTHAQGGPLSVEVSEAHPLFVFNVTALQVDNPLDHASAVIGAWTNLPDELKPFSALRIGPVFAEQTQRNEHLAAMLQRLQEAGIPIVLTVGRSSEDVLPVTLIESLVRDFTCVKSLYIEGLSFSSYYPDAVLQAMPVVPLVDWLSKTVAVAKAYNRLCTIALDDLQWVRVMSNTWCSPIYDAMVQAKGSVAVVARMRGHSTIADTSAMLGLWLEGAVDHWGIAADSRWFDDAGFIEPGVFGVAMGSEKMTPSIYRAMVWNGVMSGATVYLFSPSTDLWFGQQKRHWEQAIYPTLVEVVTRNLIAPKNLVQKKAAVAYQVSPSRTADDFHLIMRDIDGVRDKGFLMHGVYGMERPGQVPELVPNTGRYFWIPILSTYATQEVLAGFAQVVRPATINSADEWRALVDRHYPVEGNNTAFVAQIGRGIFIMHTRENLFEEQRFSVPDAPAPIRGFDVSRGDTGVTITWARREGDLEYKVYRRIAPDSRYVLIASEIEETTFLDTGVKADDTAGYTITALTNEKEPYDGTLNFGDFIALSVVESRIAEEATVNALLGYGKSEPLPPPADERPKEQTWWPNLGGLAPEQMDVAREIVSQLEHFESALLSQDLAAVTGLYADSYSDPEGWGKQYVKRAYQWFFERTTPTFLQRQIRAWDFSASAEGRVSVSLFVRCNGNALVGADGTKSDLRLSFPREGDYVTKLTFVQDGGAWRIVGTAPAFPNFKDLLLDSVGQQGDMQPGIDVFGPAK